MRRVGQRALDGYLDLDPEEGGAAKERRVAPLTTPATSYIYRLNFAYYMSCGAKFGELRDPGRAIFRCVECGEVIVGDRAAEEHMRGLHGYELDIQIWGHVEELAERMDERTAILWASGIRLRLTPPGQPTVEDLVRPGDIVWTSYSPERGRVVEVSGYEVHGLPCFSIIYVPLGAKRLSDGSYRGSDYHYLNELVAQDGRILHLYEANDDEVFYEKRQRSLKEFIQI